MTSGSSKSNRSSSSGTDHGMVFIFYIITWKYAANSQALSRDQSTNAQTVMQLIRWTWSGQPTLGGQSPSSELECGHRIILVRTLTWHPDRWISSVHIGWTPGNRILHISELCPINYVIIAHTSPFLNRIPICPTQLGCPNAPCSSPVSPLFENVSDQ